MVIQQVPTVALPVIVAHAVKKLQTAVTVVVAGIPVPQTVEPNCPSVQKQVPNIN
jgi:hypothetical protein